MGDRRASRGGTARAAVVGAAEPAGMLVRRALEDRGVDGRRVDLFGFDAGEAVLSEYAGEARLVREFDAAEVSEHDVIFVCSSASGGDRLLAAAARGALVVDLAGVWPGAPIAGAPRKAPETDRGPFAIPHAIALTLADLLRPIHEALTLRGASAVVLRPAADFGEAGMEELRDQAVRLLRFERAPTDVFGRQLAFNAIPQRCLPGGGDVSEERAASQTSALLGAGAPSVSLRLVAIPVFYGHAIALRVETARGDAEDLWEALRGRKDVVSDPGAAACSLLDAPESRKTRVTDVSPDGAGGFWIWAVAGEVAPGAAAFAVEFAATTVDL